jgi:DNA topoisomerase-1
LKRVVRVLFVGKRLTKKFIIYKNCIVKKFVTMEKLSGMPYLLIVESPSKCQKIKRLLAGVFPESCYEVMACCGHFRHIRSIHANFDISFEMDSSKQSIISKLRPYTATHEILLATDDDREGEAIAWHLCDTLSLSVDTTKRILFHEITASALKHAIENPTRVNMRIVQAQLARMICDRWIGYTFSPFLWNSLKNKSLSAGRCQTPTLKIAVDREKEIASSKPRMIFRTCAIFDSLDFVLKKELLTKSKCLEFIEKSKTFDHRIIHVTNKPSVRKAPEPFCTSTLQQWASSHWQWTPKFTMSIAQALYEKGKITYHRTESKSIAEEYREKVINYIRDQYGDTFVKVWKSSHGAKKLAHECIRPTTVEKNIEDLSMEEKKMYESIWMRTTQSVMSDAIINVLTIRISCPIPKQYYEKKLETTEFEGFRILDHSSKSKEQEILFVVDQKMEPTEIKMEQTLKDVIHHYSEGQIVKILDDKKIGRPSTFSSFVEKILSRKYVYRGEYQGQVYSFLSLLFRFPDQMHDTEKNKVIVTSLGENVCNLLYNTYNCFFNFDYTAQMENGLDQIADGTLDKNEFLRKLQKELKIDITVLRTINYTDYKDVSIRKGKTNDYIYVQRQANDKPTFLSLKNFPESYLSCHEETLVDYINLQLFPSGGFKNKG